MTESINHQGLETGLQRAGIENNEPLCPLCTAPLKKRRFSGIERAGKKYDLFFCDMCATGITVPFPSRQDLAPLYASGYRSISGKRFTPFIEKIIYFFRTRRTRRIEKYVKNGRILDIGCGRGVFLSLMKEKGWEVIGTEFDKKTASHTENSYNIPVMTSDPSFWNLSPGSFDVVTINHALEHIDDPVKIMVACRRLLKQEGLLVIAVPDIASLQAAAGKDVWFHLDIPYHLFHFSGTGLAGLLRKNGFRIVRVRRFDLEYGPYGWLQTLLNRSGIRENLLYDLLKRPELRREVLRVSRGRDVVLTFSLLPLYLPLSFVLALYESFILRRGGTVEMYAFKE